MSLQDRITVSAMDTMQHLEQNLDKLRRFQYDAQYRHLLGDALVNRMEAWDSKIRSRRKDPFTVVVVGEFKRGKSSFINSLLGEEVMITDVVPETVTMNKLSYGAHRNEAVLSGGRRLTLSDEELSRPALKRLMDEAGEPIRQLEMWRPNELLKDIRIIDTPGLNDAIDDELDAIVAEAMAQADAVIYVYSVNAPLSRSEQMYIRYAILPQQYTKLFLVGNYSDLLGNMDNLERIRTMMQERTDMLLPGEKTYLISALDEMCRKMGDARPCSELAPVLESEFDKLRKDIVELIEAKRTTIAADRMQRMTRMMVEELTADLDNLEKGLEMDASQIAAERRFLQEQEGRQTEQLEKAKAEIGEKVERMKAEAVDWTVELLNRMEREDLSAYTVHDISQYYAYYCVELLESVIRESLEMHREAMIDEMSDISDEIGKGLTGMYATGDKVKFSFRLNNSTWTRGDSIALAISQLSFVPLLSSVADLANSLTRKSELEGGKEQLLSNVWKKYPALKREALHKLDVQYASMLHSAHNLMEEYYLGQIQRASEMVAQHEETSLKRDEDKRQIQQITAELRQVLTAFAEDEID